MEEECTPCVWELVRQCLGLHHIQLTIRPVGAATNQTVEVVARVAMHESGENQFERRDEERQLPGEGDRSLQHASLGIGLA